MGTRYNLRRLGTPARVRAAAFRASQSRLALAIGRSSHLHQQPQMTHLTLTKSKTSRISRPLSKSPIKKTRSFDLKARRIVDPSEKPEPPKREPTAQKLEVIQHHVPSGIYLICLANSEPSLLVSDVLAGMTYLTGIQFPPFPEKGLGRDRIAELHAARKVSPEK